MEFRGDERAVVIQIGAVLLLAALVIAMSGYQATVVPDQNNEIEFNHNQDVQGQMQELRNGIVSAPGGGSGASVRVDLGVRYPSRTFFVNPSPASGSLRTVGTTDENFNITVDNAAASGETGQYWTGDPRRFNTGALAYEPKYSEYDDAPTTIYEQSLLYNRFADANITISEQSMVDGRQINLVALNGSLSESGTDSTSVSVRPVSASRNAVAVEGDGGDPINITVPTRLDKSTWYEALEPELDANGGNIVDRSYDTAPSREYALLTISLDGSKTYDLRMAKVGVGSDVAEESEDLYLTDVEGGGSVDTDGTQRLTVEVRDRYNNPVSGERVNLTVDGDGELDNGSATAQFVTGTSDSDGRVTVTYEAPSSETTDTVTGDIDATPTASEEVEFTMDVAAGGGGGGGGGSSSSTFEVTGLSYVDPIKQGETFKLDAEITNTGDPEDTQTIKLDFDAKSDVDREALTLADGESKTVRLKYGDTGSMTGDKEFTARTEDDSWSDTVTVEEASGPYFDAAIDATKAPITAGDTLSVDVAVENVGDAADTQTISMDFGSDANVDSRSVTLDPGQSETFTLTHDTDIGDEGDVDVTVESDNTTDTETVSVESPSEYFQVLVNDTNAPIGAGEILEVDVDLKNRGDTTAEQEISLDFDDDGSIESRKFVELTTGEERTVTLAYELPADTATGEHDLRAASENESDAATAEIESPTDFSVSIDTDNTPGEIVEGEDYGVLVDVTNGGGTGTETVELSVGSLDGETREITLDSGQSKTITLTYASQDGDAGSYTTDVAVENDADQTDLTILEDPDYVADLDRSTVPDQVSRNKDFGVSANVENRGEVKGEQDVELRLGDNLSGTEGEDYSVIDTAFDVTLDGGDSTTLDLSGTVPSDQPLGDQKVGVVTNDDTSVDTTTVNVEPGFSNLSATSNAGSGNGKVESVTYDYVIKDDVDADRIEYEIVRTDDDSTVETYTDDNPVRDGSVTLDFKDVDMRDTDLKVSATVVDAGGYSTACVGTLQEVDETIRKSDGQFACS